MAKINFTPIASTQSFLPQENLSALGGAQKINFNPLPATQSFLPGTPNLSSLASQRRPTFMQNVEGGLLKAAGSTLDDLRHLGNKRLNVLSLAGPAGQLAGRIAPAAMKAAPQIGDPSSLAYEGANIVGNTLPFIAGGEGLEAARGAAEGIPLVGRAAASLGGKGLSGVARRAIGSGLYGAVANPDNRVQGAETGALLSPALDLIPGAANKTGALLKKGALYFDPVAKSKKIFQTLGAGQSRENADKVVADNVKNAYKKVKGEANALYDRLDNTYSSSIDGGQFKLANLEELPDRLKKSISSDEDLNELHQDLLKNPSFKKARDFRTELNSEINALNPKNQPPLPSARQQAKRLGKVKTALEGDISTNLEAASPELQAMHDEAQNFYRTRVIPYREKSKIYQMATGQLTNPGNVHNYFKNPEPGTLQVLDDLSDDAKNRIMHSALGKITSQSKPATFMRNYENAINDGLESSISPELKEQMEELEKTINRNQGFTSTLGAITGAVAGSHLGDNELAPVLGGFIGKTLGQPIARGARRVIQSGPSRALQKGVKTSYPRLQQAMLANLIRGNS